MSGPCRPPDTTEPVFGASPRSSATARLVAEVFTGESRPGASRATEHPGMGSGRGGGTFWLLGSRIDEAK